MDGVVFSIPTNRADLLNESERKYTVKNVVVSSEILKKLEEARTGLLEEGPYFILDNFDTYYSILHQENKLSIDVIQKGFNSLLKAVKQLNDTILFLVEDPASLSEESKSKMANVLKMLTYIFVQFVLYLEEKNKRSGDLLSKGKKEKKHDNFGVNKSEVVKALNNIIQRPINVFWQPPIVEHEYIELLSELCFGLLQNPSIKQEKVVIMDIFGVFGKLVKSYDFGETFVARMIRNVCMYEHVVHCVPEGIKMMVEQFSCQNLVHHLIIEATEWQATETVQDVQGTRCCSIFLTELAKTVPNLVFPEVTDLSLYLAHQSVPLRTAVLNVITEIILHVLTRHDLNQEEKDSRATCFDILTEHILEYSPIIRAKVIQNLNRLQKENAIPLVIQNDVLSKVVRHLSDKSATVRKCAVSCVTTFLECNPFGAKLQLSEAEEQLAQKIELLRKMEAAYQEQLVAKVQELEAGWLTIENDLLVVVTEELKTDEDEDEDERESVESEQFAEQIQSLLHEKKYAEAFRMCRRFTNNIPESRNVANEDQAKFYMNILRSFYINTVKFLTEMRTTAGMSQEDVEKIKALEGVIKYFEDMVKFLRTIHSVVEPMKMVLLSDTMSDTHEAIKFFVSAYHFKIDNANEGIIEMLKMMRTNHEERKSAVTEALRTIYLVTDTKSMEEHTTTILNRLFALLRNLTYDRLEDFQDVVSEWTAKGILDNAVINRCWQYYTQHEHVSAEDARAAAVLLRMAAMGRKTIITKNLNVVATMAFSQQYKSDMLFLANSFRLLSVAGLDKIDVQSEETPFRIKKTEDLFHQLSDNLIENFFNDLPYYSEAMQACTDFTFRMCSKPMEIIENIIKEIDERFRQRPQTIVLSIRFLEMLGCIALKFLEYLDNGVHREMKRRTYLRQEREKAKANKKNKRKSKRQSVLDTSNASDSGSIVLGAEAEDVDTEYIIEALENDVVSKKGVLGQYAPFVLKFCQRPDIYSDVLLQTAAVTTLSRYMLISSKFCAENIRLLFTILAKTSHPDIRSTISMHCVDLLTRFPNIIDPWSPRLSEMLKDSVAEVRKNAFFSLSNLILRDMIRASSRISEMAVCLIDPDPEVSQLCRSFFTKIAQKDNNNIVSLIPDIFSYLVKQEEITEADLRYVIKFLFDLIDVPKRPENLVDRLCHKYTPDENVRLNRNITYCLSLINYNDKALQKLRDMFPLYRHNVTDEEVYSTFKQILNECGKAKVGRVDLKPIVTEIENCIASVFEIHEGGPPVKPPTVAKSGRTGRKKKGPAKRARKVQSDSEEEDSGEDALPKSTPSRNKTSRNRRNS
nr:PREDICTED: condensin complex subunit 1 isoform X2 [Tribolium castaneum]|eukprot:XP_008191925.1 PREDICTED: condensin complex subunit 1 isoform X2 [Tribolium castaneum]